jgi:hypothetical protein
LTAYHTPGVYFERRDITPFTIGIPRSDIAGFAGITMRGPLFTPVRIESWRQFVSVFGDFISQGYLAYAVYGFFANGGRTCWISRVANPSSAQYARREFGELAVQASSRGSWGARIHVEPQLSGDEVAALTVRYPDGTEEFLRAPFETDESQADNLIGLPQSSLDVRDAVQSLVTVSHVAIPTRLPEPAFLAGGSDGLSDLGPEHFEDAFECLGNISEIGVVAAPDLMPKLPIIPKFKGPPANCCLCEGVPPKPPEVNTEFPSVFTDDQIKDLQVSLAARAQALRYRIAILDTGGERANPLQAQLWRRSLPGSKFAALYYPWILVDDPLRLTGLVRFVPPSGHIAGIYARSDQRKGVHKPPMNEVLEAVSDVGFSIEDEDHGVLNDDHVNAVRIMPGRGVRVLGTRTLWFEDILWRYINVRRLVSMIERALEESLTWTVFEPNNLQLWSEIDRVVRSFLETLFRLGMLDGATSEDAYYVRCDDTTNPPSETDLGRVICEIGVRPPYPAEFVVVTLGITKDGIQVREGREQSA